MTEWFCTKCYSVFMSRTGKCCGDVEVFDVSKHGRKLIPSSNAWISIWNKWKDDPLLEKISKEWARNGNCSAPGILNDFIEYLKIKQEDELNEHRNCSVD